MSQIAVARFSSGRMGRKASTCTPLAPGLSRRPCAAAYGLGPSVFTLRAEPRSNAPCRAQKHGSRLGFPGRRSPGVPAASGDVARDLPVLPQQGRRKIGGDSGDSRTARLPERPGARGRGGWCHRTGNPRNCPLTKDDCPSRSCDRRQDPRAACERGPRISLDGQRLRSSQ